MFDPDHGFQTLVLCLDGTGDQFDDANVRSNTSVEFQPIVLIVSVSIDQHRQDLWGSRERRSPKADGLLPVCFFIKS